MKVLRLAQDGKRRDAVILSQAKDLYISTANGVEGSVLTEKTMSARRMVFLSKGHAGLQHQAAGRCP